MLQVSRLPLVFSEDVYMPGTHIPLDELSRISCWLLYNVPLTILMPTAGLEYDKGHGSQGCGCVLVGFPVWYEESM